MKRGPETALLRADDGIRTRDPTWFLDLPHHGQKAVLAMGEAVAPEEGSPILPHFGAHRASIV